MEPARRDRVLLAMTVFAVLFAQVLLYPGVPDLVAALGATTAALDASTWFLGIEFAGFVLAAGLWGVASDAAGRRVPFIAAGAVGGAAGYLALALAPSAIDATFGLVLVLRFLQGAATIGAFSLAMTMLMDLPAGHGRNMGAAGIAIGLGTAAGAPVGGRLTTIDPLLPLFVAAGMLLVVAVVVSRVRDRAPDPDRSSIRDVVRRLATQPPLGIPFAFGFIDRLTAGFFALVGTLYFRTVFELDAAATGLVLALFFAPFALLQYPFGVLSDRIGRTAPVVGGSAFYGVALTAVGLAPALELAAGLMVVVGVLGALMAPATMALVTDLAGTRERGAAMAGFNISGSIGFFVGIVLGGTVASLIGFRSAFLAVGALEVALAVIALPFLLRLDLDAPATFGG
jgi:MFS family permease